MAAQEPGGRKTRVGGLTLSPREKTIIDRARKRMHPPMSRAEFLREGGLRFAVELSEERGFELVRPEESREDPNLWDLYLQHRAELARRHTQLRRSGTK